MTKSDSKLLDKCHSLAKSLRWQREPFDAKEISKLGDYFYEIALSSVRSLGSEREKNIVLVCGAIDFLYGSISGPNNEDPDKWFYHSLRTLIFILKPFSNLETPETVEFMVSLRSSITRQIESQNA